MTATTQMHGLGGHGAATTPTPTINRDVWWEILQYFQVSLPGDDPDEIVDKRRAILSIALTCSGLVEVALDELWRTMTTLQPILCVVNDPDDHPPEGTLFYQDRYADLPFWKLTMSSAGATRCLPRIQSYLCRIRCLHFDENPYPKELSLWQILSGLIRTSTLCPNITHIWLSMTGFYMNSNWAPYFFHVLSPSLESVTIENCEGTDISTLHIFLGILRCQGAPILEMSYRGFIHKDVFRLITPFPSLRSITVEPIGYCSLHNSDLQILQSLLNLTSVEFSLYHTTEKFQVTLGWHLASLKALFNLTLSGTGDAIDRCLFHHSLKFKTVLSLTLTASSPLKPYYNKTPLFALINSRLPQLHTLNVEVSDKYIGYENAGVEQEPFNIFQLQTRSMKRLRLRGLLLDIGAEDFASSVSGWSLLEEISLSLPKETFDAELILRRMSSEALNLRVLGLPFDFSSLQTTLLPSSPSRHRCPLRQLSLFDPVDLPTELDEVHNLTRNLLTLFPHLTDIEGPESSTGLETFRRTLAAFRGM